ncbi:hypothetical protein [Bradyrhizobium sp. 188]|uniref:hypothetical protein n=1 Tax=Bradyrhizobium sp. 188 TaxID=2782656 RepID=UPI001FFB7EF0|nr:hypothetical protein [Bradyrhizobium sp. 188]MCK1501746.1 hypothetical protein [Bradyrhizobium sp. 188]
MFSAVKPRLGSGKEFLKPLIHVHGLREGWKPRWRRWGSRSTGLLGEASKGGSEGMVQPDPMIDFAEFDAQNL